MANVEATTWKHQDATPPAANFEVVQEFEDLAIRALYIEEILEKVLAYLPVSDLQSARLVCQKWNDLGAVALEARATLQLPNKEGELPSRLFNSVTIKSVNDNFGQDFLTPLHNLFQKEGNNVKNLTIDNNKPLDRVKIYGEIFNATSEIETLCLKWFDVICTSETDASILFDGKFPKLTTLQIGHLRPILKNANLSYQGNNDRAMLGIWIEQLFRTNITTLQLQFASCEPLQICQNLLIADETKRPEELLPKLECAEIKATMTGLKFLLNLKHTLKKISFQDLDVNNYLDHFQESHSDMLEQVLKKHAESLEVLHIFALYSCHCTPGATGFQWPLLPRLKHLYVGGKRYALSIQSFDPFHIKDLFQNSAELVAKMPNLEQLTLNFQYHESLETFYKWLFLFPCDSEDKKFPQIKKLEVYHNLASMMDKEWKETQSGWNKIFPNAEITLLPSKKL